MSTAGIKVFQALSVRDHPTTIDDKHSPDLSNVLVNNPIGALSNMEGTEKYNSVGFGNPIVAIHQLNGHIFSLQGSTLYEGKYVDPFAGYTAITNCVELQAMQNNLAGKYYLGNALDCTYCTQNAGGALYNAGAGFEPIGTHSPYAPFTGIFDGNGKTITGLKINRPSINYYVGLFGYPQVNSEIKNVGLIDCDIIGGDYAGTLLGLNYATVTKCYCTGVIGGQNPGGFVGQNAAGAQGNGTITNCYSVVTINGNYGSGFVMDNNGTVVNCYSAGAVSSGWGFCGAYGGTAVFTDNFCDTQAAGQGVGAGATAKTTAQMKQEATFTNWDFTTIWAIVEGVSYPTLR